MLCGKLAAVNIFLTIFFIAGTNGLRVVEDLTKQLANILKDKSRNPLIVLVDAAKGPNLPDFYDVDPSKVDEANDDSPDEEVIGYEKKAEKKAIMMLKKIIHSPDKDLDPTAIKTKHALRKGLISRCGKVENCVKKCPPRKPHCQMGCQQVFDDLNLCEETTTTRRPKNCATGRTMPPNWRL